MESGVFVGVDVSKDRLDVHVLPSGEVFAVARDGDGINELITRLAALSPVIIGVEATGGFETVVAAGVAGAGLSVAVINPAQVRAFAHAMGQRAKTDPIDAAVIALFVQAVRPQPRALPDAQQRLLADLVSRRRQIVQMIGAERQRLGRAVEARLRKSLTRLIAALERELAEVNQEIDDSLRGSPAWKAKEDLLTTVPGVGANTARTLIAEMPELGQLDRKQIAALAGLAPWTRQSGKWKGKSMIGGGRTSIRSAMFVVAMVAARHNPVLKAFHQRLIQAGKPKMVALVAVARRMLTILNAMIRDNKPWQPA